MRTDSQTDGWTGRHDKADCNFPRITSSYVRHSLWVLNPCAAGVRHIIPSTFRSHNTWLVLRQLQYAETLTKEDISRVGVLCHRNRSTQFQTFLFFLGCPKIQSVGQDTSVAKATRNGLDGPVIEPRCRREFPHPSRLSLGPTKSPVQRYRVRFQR